MCATTSANSLGDFKILNKYNTSSIDTKLRLRPDFSWSELNEQFPNDDNYFANLYFYRVFRDRSFQIFFLTISSFKPRWLQTFQYFKICHWILWISFLSQISFYISISYLVCYVFYVFCPQPSCPTNSLLNSSTTNILAENLHEALIYLNM